MSTSKPSVLIAGPNGTVGSSVVNAILKRKDKFHNLGFLVNEDAPRYDF